MAYSILLTVYSGESPAFFKDCLASMFAQTVMTDDFVLMCDGALRPEHHAIIKEYESRYPEIFHPVFLKKNIGTGRCKDQGIALCKNELIAIMDSDDISVPERCALQVAYFESHPETGALGGYVREFDSATGKTIALRKTPLSDVEIKQYARRRNPLNNQTIMFRKSLMQKIGRYSTLPRCEDYDFVSQLILAGAVCANLPQVLVDYRVTSANYERRSSWVNTKAFIAVRWKNFRRGLSSFTDFLVPCVAQLLLFLLPKKLTGKFYQQFLR